MKSISALLGTNEGITKNHRKIYYERLILLSGSVSTSSQIESRKLARLIKHNNNG
jgi:hypothetical protein